MIRFIICRLLGLALSRRWFWLWPRWSVGFGLLGGRDGWGRPLWGFYRGLPRLECRCSQCGRRSSGRSTSRRVDWVGWGRCPSRVLSCFRKVGHPLAGKIESQSIPCRSLYHSCGIPCWDGSACRSRDPRLLRTDQHVLPHHRRDMRSDRGPNLGSLFLSILNKVWSTAVLSGSNLIQQFFEIWQIGGVGHAHFLHKFLGVDIQRLAGDSFADFP